MARNYTLGGHFATFEFGGKFRNAHKFEDTNDFVYDSATSPAMTTFLGSFTNPDYYDKSYSFGPTTQFSKITSFFNSNRSDFPLNESDTRQSTDPNNYDLMERVSAGYLMNTVDFGRVRLQTGLRFEHTSENVLGFHIQLDDNGDYVPGSTTQSGGILLISTYCRVSRFVSRWAGFRDSSGLRGEGSPGLISATCHRFRSETTVVKCLASATLI